MNRGVLLLPVLALLVGMARKPESVIVEAVMDWDGQNCSVGRPTTVVAKSPEEWKRLWDDSVGRPAPEADLSGRFAVAVFVGAVPTGGYSVEFLEPVAKGGTTVIPYRIRKPGKGSFVIQAFTQPFAIRLFTGDASDVEVREAD